jgi:hypothetical protein
MSAWYGACISRASSICSIFSQRLTSVQGGTDIFLFASFPLATRENITVISNSISLSDPHTLALNGPLMHTHSDPSSGLNFRITPNPHTHPDVTVKAPLDWKCLYNIPRNLVIFFHDGFWKILIGGSSRCDKPIDGE